MKFPERFSNLPAYAFPRLRALLAGLEPGGPEIQMTIGEPKHAFPAWVTDVITRNAAQNGVAGIDIRHGAVVAGKASTQSFFLRGAFWAGSTDERHVKDVEVTVPALGFGTLCREMRPTIIVADLEGGERHLFDEGVIDSVRVIVMELHENRYGQDGIRALFDRLSEAGFAYDPNGSRGKVVVFRRADE